MYLNLSPQRSSTVRPTPSTSALLNRTHRTHTKSQLSQSMGVSQERERVCVDRPVFLDAVNFFLASILEPVNRPYSSLTPLPPLPKPTLWTHRLVKTFVLEFRQRSTHQKLRPSPRN
ncbi:unnamed protein product [Ectocarpus sp. 12 AP-2014]